MEADRKKTQYVVMGVLAVLVLGMFIVMNSLMSSGPNLPVSSSSQVVDETIIRDRTSNASPEMSWVRTGRLEVERLRNSLAEQEKTIRGLRKEYDKDLVALRAEYDEILEQQILKINALTDQVKRSGEVPETQRPSMATGGERTAPAASQSSATTPYGNDFIRREKPSRAAPQKASEDATKSKRPGFGQSFKLAALPAAEDAAENRNVKRLSNYLPAGSYAPAVVLTGADAATNVANRDNPIPVLFRITGPAVTAAARGKGAARVNLKGCTVQGSATGDLSSERVKVRLLTMTCLSKRGDVLETKVSGYMSGSGKEGVRGQVVSREGPAVRNALVAGLLGGATSALDQAAGASLGQEDASTAQILEGAGLSTIAGGAQSAANTLAEYYIQRAEQYQPVVSLYGGTNVELVFLEGVELTK